MLRRILPVVESLEGKQLLSGLGWAVAHPVHHVAATHHVAHAHAYSHAYAVKAPVVHAHKAVHSTPAGASVSKAPVDTTPAAPAGSTTPPQTPPAPAGVYVDASNDVTMTRVGIPVKMTVTLWNQTSAPVTVPLGVGYTNFYVTNSRSETVYVSDTAGQTDAKTVTIAPYRSSSYSAMWTPTAPGVFVAHPFYNGAAVGAMVQVS